VCNKLCSVVLRASPLSIQFLLQVDVKVKEKEIAPRSLPDLSNIDTPRTRCISLNCPLDVPQLSLSRAPIDSPSDLSLRSPQLPFHTHLQKAITAHVLTSGRLHCVPGCDAAIDRRIDPFYPSRRCPTYEFLLFWERDEFVSRSESVLKSRTAHEYEKKEERKKNG